jgi:hypothetical protein
MYSHGRTEPGEATRREDRVDSRPSGWSGLGACPRTTLGDVPNIPVDLREDPNEPEPDEHAAEDDLDERYHWLVAKPDPTAWSPGPSEGLPSTILIGGRPYEVRVFEFADKAGHHGEIGGYFDEDASALYVWRSDMDKRHVLLHEVLHAIDNVAGTEAGEAVVRAWAPILLDLLRRNPEVVEFLVRAADMETGRP